MFLVDGLDLHGKSDDGTTSTSPFRVVKDVSIKGGSKKYQWIENNQSEGDQLLEPPRRSNSERKLSLLVFPRFTTSYTNLLTNPRPASATTWSASGTIGSGPTFDSQLDANTAVTNGNANTGIRHSFTGTVAAYSGGAWVKAPSGAAMRILFDGETGVAFTGTGDWQFVKTEGVTLTVATRYLAVHQTSASTQTFYVKWVTVVLGSTFPTDAQGKYATFHGGCGDAIWNGSADASTSTTMTTAQNAVDHAIGALEAKGELAESKAYTGGITYTWQPQGSTFEVYCDMLAGEVTEVLYDQKHAVSHVAECEFSIVLAPFCEAPEELIATGYRRAGQSACSLTTTSVGGDLPARARYELTSTSTSDQRAIFIGGQWHDTDSNSLTIAASSFGVSGYSGTLTSAVNEVQTIDRTGTISSGTFTLTCDSQTTGTLQYNDNAATIQAALEALTNIGSGNVAVTGGPLSTTDVVLTFQGELAGTNVPALTISTSLGGGGTAVMVQTTAGVPSYVSGGLYDEWTTLCDTGAISFVGSYRVIASVYDNASTSEIGSALLRFTYGLSDLASTKTGPIVSPPAVGDYSIVDLGDVTIPAAPNGTQKWLGKLEAKTTGTAGNTLRAVKLHFFPTEIADGVVKAVTPSTSTVSMYEDFGATSGALTGDTATSGQTWASAGGVTDANDFTETAAPDNAVIRTDVSDTATSTRNGRGVVLGSATPTDVKVQTALTFSTYAVTSFGGVLARFTDNSNYVTALIAPNYTNAGKVSVGVAKVVAGTTTTLFSAYVDASATANHTISFTAYASGLWRVHLDGESVVSGVDSVFATGGTLASGKSGLLDWCPGAGAVTRTYSNFSVSTPVAESIALNTTRKAEFRDDGTAWRQDSTGTYYGYPQQQTIPVAPQLGPSSHGQPANRILALTSRNNPDLASDPAWDPFTLKLYAKRRYAVSRWET
jgi:hypothetical protein